MADTIYKPRMRAMYDDRIAAAMTEKFGYTNVLEVPRMEKIVLNMGVGEAVNDGKIIVLGGLIEDGYESEAGQVPFMSELPLVGGLFRYLTRTRKKTNLVVFLRPYVMADESATDALSVNRYDLIRAKQREHPMDVRQVLQSAEMPALPAIEPLSVVPGAAP